MNCSRHICRSMKFLCLMLTAVQIPSLLFAQWEDPVIDTITNTQIRKETTVQSLCIDDSDMVHLVWKHQVTGGWRIFYRTNSPGGMWGEVQVVGDSMEVAFEPAMAWSSIIGTPFVVYVQNSEIYAAYLSAGVWEAGPITSSTQSDASPTIAIDGWGMPHAAWITDDSISGDYKIAYASSYLVGPNLGWEIQTLAGSELGPYGSGASPFIAVTPEGIAHVVYRGGDYGNYHIHHAWNDSAGGDWNYEILYSGNANDFCASMVIEENGDLHLAVSGNDGWGFPGRVYYFHKPSGQTWEQYELASLSGSAAEPSLSVDGQGAPHIVWMEISGNFYTGNIYYSGKDSTGAWQVSMVIGGDHFVPSFQIDQEGYGHVACHTGGNTSIYDIYHVKSSGVLTCVEEFEEPADKNASGYILHSFPNPIRTQAEISYFITDPGHVSIKVYNSIGEEIAELVGESRTYGIYSVVWRPVGLSAGIYFLHLAIGRSGNTTKCILLP
jgi:hypothetical protein